MKKAFRKRGKAKLEWKDDEKRIAKRIGGRRHAFSGAHFMLKGDVSNELLVVECKSTAKKSMILKQDWLEKISWETGLGSGKSPAVTITFQNIDKRIEKDWILVPLKYFEEMLEIISDMKGEQENEK